MTRNPCSFLRLFSNEQETWGGVCLDSAAKKLHVERRRIYDIVNVLESVEIVARRAKNKYAWYGMTRLPQAIERLRTATLAELNQEPAERHAAEAELASKSAMPVSRDVGHDPSFLNNAGPSSQADAEKSRESVVSASACECEKNQNEVEGSAVAVNSGVDQVAQLSTVTPCADALIETDSQSRAAVKVANLENPTDACSTEDESCPEKLPIPTALSQEPPPAGCEVPPKSTIIPGVADSTYYAFLEMYRMQKASRREKSLGVLSQKFVQLFLNSEHGVVSLEPAARRLLEEDTFNDEGQLKTKIRRLYDIANILCSLNLVHHFFFCSMFDVYVLLFNFLAFRLKKLRRLNCIGSLHLSGFMIQQKPITGFAMLTLKPLKSQSPLSRLLQNPRKKSKNPNQ